MPSLVGLVIHFSGGLAQQFDSLTKATANLIVQTPLSTPPSIVKKNRVTPGITVLFPNT
jgi:hypothetical protein